MRLETDRPQVHAPEASVLQRTRLLLVQPDPLAERTLIGALQHHDDAEILGVVRSGREALLRVRDTWPHVLILDARLPDVSGVQLAHTLLRSELFLPILLIYDEEPIVHLVRALRSDVKGFLRRDEVPEQVYAATRGLAGGGAHIHPQLLARLIDAVAAAARHLTVDFGAYESLSPHERRILRQIVLGKTNRHIASILGQTEGAVKQSVTRLLQTLRIKNRTQAALIGLWMEEEITTQGIHGGARGDDTDKEEKLDSHARH
jgi:DNA-binding NarL/FixJ family response regulator